MNDIDILATIGRNIKTIRSKKNMKQRELASRAEMEKSNISRIESGQVNMTIITLKTISDALEMEIYDLLK